MLQCVVGVEQSCADTFVAVVSPEGGRVEADVFVPRLYETPRGPHDCVLDGACELRFTTGDGRPVEPVPLGFDEGYDLPRPRLDIRPRVELTDGQTVEVRLSEALASTVVFELCVPERFFCSPLRTGRLGDGTLVRLPRVLERRTGEARTSFDCAIQACVVRATGDGIAVDETISFDPATPRRPPAELAVDLNGALTPGDDLEVAARGIFVANPDPDARPLVDIRFCEAPNAPTSRCVNAVGSDNRVDASGELRSTISIPNFDRRRSGGGQSSGTPNSPFCGVQCWIVVEPRVSVPGASTAIEIVTPAEQAD